MSAIARLSVTRSLAYQRVVARQATLAQARAIQTSSTRGDIDSAAKFILRLIVVNSTFKEAIENAMKTCKVTLNHPRNGGSSSDEENLSGAASPVPNVASASE